MVKKMKRSTAANATPSAAGLMDSHLASSVKDSAQQIWLAGMGAFSKAQEEGGKVFEALVKEGMSLQKKTQGLAEEKIGEVTGKMSAMAGTVTAKAGQNWDKLESIFEARTAKAMAKLGVPTAKDVEALIKRVDTLAAAVAKLSKGTAGAAAQVPAKRAAKAVPKASTKASAKAPAKARKTAAQPAPVVVEAAAAAPAPAKRATRRKAAATA
jgi:poly(hydroxyalkanoate) granule-associated protein